MLLPTQHQIEIATTAFDAQIRTPNSVSAITTRATSEVNLGESVTMTQLIDPNWRDSAIITETDQYAINLYGDRYMLPEDATDDHFRLQGCAIGQYVNKVSKALSELRANGSEPLGVFIAPQMLKHLYQWRNALLVYRSLRK